MEHNTAETEREDRMSVSVFLTDVFCPHNRHKFFPSDRILLVWNKAKPEEGKRAGVSMPGGHIEEGEFFWDAALRESIEETGVGKEKGQIQIINHRRLFFYDPGLDKKAKKEYDKDRYLIAKTHWHLTVVFRLLVSADEIPINLSKPGIKKAEWRRFDQLPSGLYVTHRKRIRLFQNILSSDKELFNYVFKQKS